MHDQSPLSLDVTKGNHTQTTVILIHGRGSSPEDMLAFAKEHLPTARYVALRADNAIWFPAHMIAPTAQNEEHVTAALDAIQRTIDEQHIDARHLVILGFSQGACLAAEFVSRNPRPYQGVIILSGGLMGVDVTHRKGSLAGTPILISSSLGDHYLSPERAQKTASALTAQDAIVDVYHYPGSTHTVTAEEIARASRIIDGRDP